MERTGGSGAYRTLAGVSDRERCAALFMCAVGFKPGFKTVRWASETGSHEDGKSSTLLEKLEMK